MGRERGTFDLGGSTSEKTLWQVEPDCREGRPVRLELSDN